MAMDELALIQEVLWIAEGSTDVLAEDMVVSVEPGIYLHDEGRTGGYRLSDSVPVTSDGGECLAGFADDLGSLTIRARKPLARFRAGLIRVSLRLGWKARESRRTDLVHRPLIRPPGA